MGGGEVLVAEEFLNAAKVGAGVEQVGGVAVAQLMRGDRGIKAGGSEMMF